MANENHSDRKHARLSASGSKRWINCSPSIHLEEQYTAKFGEKSSDYAREGTLAHEFAELFLKYDCDFISDEQFAKEFDELKTDKYFTSEMITQVEKYSNFVFDRFQNMKLDTPGAVISIEERLDFSHIVPGGFGTGDAGICGDNVLEVIDLKYGKGVPVSAENNPQLKLYGLGALKNMEIMFDIETVVLTVVQPRLDSISSWSISVEDLKSWGENVVKPAAAAAINGEGETNPGDWCRFCKAKARCPGMKKRSLEIAKMEFARPEMISDEELLETYLDIKLMTSWFKSVQEHVYEQALAGKSWNGMKLVQGKSNRRWTFPDRVIEALREKGFKDEDIITSKLNGIGAISNLMSVDAFQEFEQYLVKPQGKPVLVPVGDKRPELGIEQAKLDFE